MAFSVLVEGSDDKHLIKNVAREHGLDLDSTKDFHDCGGIERLLHEVLPIMLKSSERAIAVVVDADLDLLSRWQAITHRLADAGYTVPSTPDAGGLILTDRRPAVGLWIMPDNSLPGAIEDFAVQLIPSGDELWPRAVDAVADIPQADRRFATGATRKAEIHTYLAWQEEPGTPLGLAVTKTYFKTDAELCRTFINWLKRVKALAQSE